MLHIHTDTPAKFQNKDYVIKFSDFVLAKSQIIQVDNLPKHTVQKKPSKIPNETPTSNKKPVPQH